MDMTRLARVAVIRLCTGFSKYALPGVDWPDHMRDMICAHHALVQGGLEGRAQANAGNGREA